MKKTLLTIISILVIVTMLLSIYFAIDVEKNLAVRRKVFSILDSTETISQSSKVIYAMGETAVFDEN